MDDVESGTAREDVWMRTAARIADLGNPFYAEERQRDVWNEASAVGIQLIIWTGLVAAAVLAWLPDGAGAMSAAVVLGVVGLGAGTTAAYAQHLGVVEESRDRASGRLLAMALLVLVIAAGLCRWWVLSSRGGGFWGGFRTGATVSFGLVGLVIAAVVVVDFLRRRR